MKIWHITRTPNGGAGQYALRLCQAMNGRGYDSRVLTVERAPLGDADGMIRNNGCVRQFSTRAVAGICNRLASAAYSSTLRFDRWVAPEEISPDDIVHLHGMTGWIGTAGLRQFIPHGANVFWTAHDLWCISGGCVVYAGCERYKSGCTNCPILPAPVRWVLPRLELANKQRLIRDYRIRGIANSNWMKQQLADSKIFKNQQDIQIVPPIIHDSFLKLRPRTDARRQLGLETDKFVIALGARAVTDQFKGIKPFLEQLANDRELSSKALVLLFGDGKIAIPEAIKVREFGAISDANELANVLAAAHVFVSPSKMETFGMTLVEAQACGTPVLCFSVGGTPEAVRDGETGWLVPLDDYQALLNRLRSLVNDMPQCLAFGEKARKWAQQTFCAKAVAAQQESIYSKTG